MLRGFRPRQLGVFGGWFWDGQGSIRQQGLAAGGGELQHALIAWEKSAHNLRLIGIFAAVLALLYTAALHKTILDGERTREELRERLAKFEAGGASGVIFGTSGYDVERELRAFAEVAGLR